MKNYITISTHYKKSFSTHHILFHPYPPENFSLFFFESVVCIVSAEGVAMRAISIVGYKDTGKTGLSKNILDYWQRKSVAADYLKYSHRGFDAADTDTFKMTDKTRTVFGLSENESIAIYGEKLSLLNVLSMCKNELLLVEGGKQELILPRVICTDNRTDFEKLSFGLAIATFSNLPTPPVRIVPHFTPKTLDKLADLMLEKAFVLAGLNCKACGRKTCYELAQDILIQKAKIDDCMYLNKKSNFELKANGKTIPLNDFTESMLSSVISAMMKELKGYAGGDISIHIKK